MLFIDYLRLARRSVLLIVLLIVAGAAGGFGVSAAQTPQYQATTRIFISAQQAANLADLSQGTDFVQELVQSYVQVADSPLVLKPVIAALGLKEDPDDLAKRVQVTSPLNTVVLVISVEDTSPVQAARIANQIGLSLSAAVATLTPSTADTTAPVKLYTLADAEAPTAPVSPKIPINVLIGVVVGLALAVFLILIRDAIRRQALTVARVQRRRQVERRPLRGTPSEPAVQQVEG